MNRFTVRQTHRDIMDDSDTNCYKWWDNVDLKENFQDILKRVDQADFASDEERIVEAMHILRYLFDVEDNVDNPKSKGTDGEDDWDAIRAVKSILEKSKAYQAWDNKRINSKRSKKS